MIVTIDGHAFRLRFEHMDGQWPLHLNDSLRKELADKGVFVSWPDGTRVNVDRKLTFCIVEVKDGLDSDSWSDVAVGHSVCMYGDNFSKNDGRRRSLDRCMRSLPDSLKPHTCTFLRAYYHRKLA